MEFGALLAREAGGSVLQGEIPGVAMGIRNPQNSEEQPRKSGSLVELGEGGAYGRSPPPEERGACPFPGCALPHPTPVLSPRLSQGLEEGKGGRS